MLIKSCVNKLFQSNIFLFAQDYLLLQSKYIVFIRLID